MKKLALFAVAASLSLSSCSMIDDIIENCDISPKGGETTVVEDSTVVLDMPLVENFKDQSVYHTGATVNGTVAFENAAVFTGYGNYIDLGNPAQLAISDNFKLNVSVKIDYPQNSREFIYFRGDGRIALDPITLNITQNNEFKFAVEDSLGNIGAVIIPMDTTVYGKWVDISCEYNKDTKSMSMAINDEKQVVETNVVPFSKLSSDKPIVRIGAYESSWGEPGNYFNGKIKNITITTF